MSDDERLSEDSFSSPSPSSGEERERIIREVLRERHQKEQALEFQRLRMERRKQKKRGLGIRHGLLLLASVVAVAVWSSGTPWFQEPPPPPLTQAHEEASLRFALYLQAQQIEGFQRERGRLPDDLSEVGAIHPGIRYFKTERGTYHLEGTTDRFALFYASSLARTPAEFLEGAERRLFSRHFTEDSS